jgi:general stress protein CsbA
MVMTRTKILHFLLGPALLLVCFSLLQFSFRSTALVLMLALFASYVHFLRTSETKWMRLIFVTFLIAAFLPIDVTLQNVPGPPRFVPLIMGTPTEEDSARADRGEVVLGFCILRGNEPKWVWVW